MQMDPVIRARRKAFSEAQAWLHARALEINDPHARQVLNSAAFTFGIEKLRGFDPKTGKRDWEARSPNRTLPQMWRQMVDELSDRSQHWDG